MIERVMGAMEVFGLAALMFHYEGVQYLIHWQFQLACWFVVIPLIWVIILAISINEGEK